MYLNNLPAWINTEEGLVAIGSDKNAHKHTKGPEMTNDNTETLDETYRRGAAAVGVPEKELREKYGHLNLGMQKMNLNNRLRNFNKVAK